MPSPRVLFPVVALMLSVPAVAQPKGYSGPVTHATTWKNTCGQVQALVARRGFAVLTYAGSGAAAGSVLFGGDAQNRVVADQTFCLPRQSTQPIWVPTRDNTQCFAGYTCEEGSVGNSGSRGRR